MEKHNQKPQLRFPNFSKDWILRKFGELTERESNPVKVKDNELYRQIGIRSHGKGIFHKEPLSGKELGNKRVFWVKENAFVVNIVFAWEQAVAKTTNDEVGMIASHRFPMYLPKPKEADLDYLLYYFLTKKGKTLLELASPGGAGRNKTLGQKEFEKLKLVIPCKEEQTKIASFVTLINKKLQTLKRKKKHFEEYKKGVMQKLFSQELRFKDEEGYDFPDWEEKKLDELAVKKSSTLSANKIEDNFGEFIIYGASGILKRVDFYEVEDEYISIVKDGAGVGRLFYCAGKTSVLGTMDIIKPKEFVNTQFLFYLLGNIDFTKYITGSTIPHIYFKDYKNEICSIPSIPEQTKIAKFLSALDEKIKGVQAQIEKTESWKKGLLQKMFC